MDKNMRMIKENERLKEENHLLVETLAKANLALLALKKHISWLGISLVSDCKPLTVREADALRRCVDLEGMEPMDKGR